MLDDTRSSTTHESTFTAWAAPSVQLGRKDMACSPLPAVRDPKVTDPRERYLFTSIGAGRVTTYLHLHHGRAVWRSCLVRKGAACAWGGPAFDAAFADVIAEHAAVGVRIDVVSRFANQDGDPLACTASLRKAADVLDAAPPVDPFELATLLRTRFDEGLDVRPFMRPTEIAHRRKLRRAARRGN